MSLHPIEISSHAVSINEDYHRRVIKVMVCDLRMMGESNIQKKGKCRNKMDEKKGREDLNLAWADVYAKYHYKSLDHHSFSLKNSTRSAGCCEASDSHILAERARREKINAWVKLLQKLVPGCEIRDGPALVDLATGQEIRATGIKVDFEL
ncbi:hypothetical protein Rs2_16069 [Raphanus sativus]|nr:hypothetical protein Rs2_16069 [Raphanus sativus]